MTHYSEDPRRVRVDFFKPSGKWYATEAVLWTGRYGGKDQLIHDAFKTSLQKHFEDHPNSLKEMDAICLKPYHENAHPIQIKAGGWNK